MLERKKQSTRCSTPDIIVSDPMPQIFLAAILCASALSAADDVLARVAAHADRFGAVSRQIWETPELGYHEAKSSAPTALKSARTWPACPRRSSRHSAAANP